MNRCANCTGIVEDGTGRQLNRAWLDDYCLSLLATRGYLVGKDMTGPERKMCTLLNFMRDGNLVNYLAPREFWQMK